MTLSFRHATTILRAKKINDFGLEMSFPLGSWAESVSNACQLANAFDDGQGVWVWKRA